MIDSNTWFSCWRVSSRCIVLLVALLCSKGCDCAGLGCSASKAAQPCTTKQTSASPLPGVSIHVVGPSCAFSLAEAAEGVQIAYEVRVEDAVAGVVSMPQDSGRCGRPDESGLIPFARITGGGQSYCVCDTGLCPSPDAKPMTLSPGVYRNVVTWSGRNWSGPSDTSRSEGAPFPAGTYTLTLRAKGTKDDKPFDVSASAELMLVR